MEERMEVLIGGKYKDQMFFNVEFIGCSLDNCTLFDCTLERCKVDYIDMIITDGFYGDMHLCHIGDNFFINGGTLESYLEQEVDISDLFGYE